MSKAAIRTFLFAVAVGLFNLSCSRNSFEGDIIAVERLLPVIEEGDIVGVMDAGAYGYSMSSNYNNRLRPAEVLIKSDGSVGIIRRRDTLDDLLRNFE